MRKSFAILVFALVAAAFAQDEVAAPAADNVTTGPYQPVATEGTQAKNTDDDPLPAPKRPTYNFSSFGLGIGIWHNYEDSKENPKRDWDQGVVFHYGRIWEMTTHGAITFMNSIPMVNPDVITGVSLFLLFIFLHFTQGYASVTLAHITFCIPYVVLSVLPKLTQMNPNIYEAALDLGATPSQAFWKVMVPELRPGMISGFILAFTMSLDDFAVTFFTRGTIGLETLSTYIYTDARKGGLTPELRPLMTTDRSSDFYN